MLIKQGKTQIIQNVSAKTAPFGDTMLIGFWWENLSKSTHYFKCRTETIQALYPNVPELIPPTEWDVVRVLPGTRAFIPHRYYTVSTRDGTPVTGREIRGEFATA